MTPRLSPTLLALGLALAAAGAARAEGAFAQLYAARPPAGSSFVRIVNPESAPMRAQVAGGPAQDIGPSKPATTYAIVKGDQEFKVQVDGKPAGALQVAPDSFTTLVARRDGGKVTLARIDDSGGAQDALKAELRFYNLIPAAPARRSRSARKARRCSTISNRRPPPRAPSIPCGLRWPAPAARPPAPSWRCPRYSPAIITACSSAAPPPCRR